MDKKIVRKWGQKGNPDDELQRPFESICLICHKIGRIIQLQNIPNKSKIIHIIYKNSKKKKKKNGLFGR
jgi:hypothetical protein